MSESLLLFDDETSIYSDAVAQQTVLVFDGDDMVYEIGTGEVTSITFSSGPPGPPGDAGQWTQVTQAEYDALVPDPAMLYVVVG